MNNPNNLNNPANPENLVKSRFKIVVEAPAPSSPPAGGQGGFSREFATIKAMSQYRRRNPNMQAVSYTFHNGAWERFVIHGSQVIPESVLRSLLNSLNSSNSFSLPCGEGRGEVNEGSGASSTNHLLHNPIN